jgi:hypothetical protein
VGAPKKQTRLESPENQSTWLPSGENHSTSGMVPSALLPPCRNLRRLSVGLLSRWRMRVFVNSTRSAFVIGRFQSNQEMELSWQ